MKMKGLSAIVSDFGDRNYGGAASHRTESNIGSGSFA